MVGRSALVLLLVVGLRARQADACTVVELDLEPGPMGRGLGLIDPEEPVRLPSEPTVVLHSQANVVLVDVRADGEPVDYDVIPTERPDRTLLRLHVTSGEVVFRFQEQDYEWRHSYLVVPGFAIPHTTTQPITGEVFDDGERFHCSGEYGRYQHGVLLHVPSEALLYRVEWSDGRVDQFDWWPVLDRPERTGLSFIVVGVFSDGEQAVLLDSTAYRGSQWLPRGVDEDVESIERRHRRSARASSWYGDDDDDDDAAWMIAAGLGVAVLALGLVTRRARAIAGT